jgi:uncharacterized protein (TIGR03083 family)
MSFEGMAGMRASLDDVSTLLASLNDDEWNAPSAAAGWTVKDVATHVPDLQNILVTAVQGQLNTDLGIEPLNDARVAAKSSWSPAQVLDDLTRQSAIALPMFEGLQTEPNASTEVQLLDLGTYVSTAAVIQSTSHEFTAWATTRLPWRDHTTVTGDQQTAATFLDTLNLI